MRWLPAGKRLSVPRLLPAKLTLPLLLFGILMLYRSISLSKRYQEPQDICATGVGSALCTGEFNYQEKSAEFLGAPISPLASALPVASPQEVVLGASAEEKWIDIDLATQTLRAMEGDNRVMEFKISSGKWVPTPIGEYRIWIKLRYTKMSGGSKANNTYYYLPNVPYVMYFYKGYGIHGAYWHNNFGHPMSHGCINMSIPDAQRVFDWATPALPEGKSVIKSTQGDPGTRVVIHGTTPRT